MTECIEASMFSRLLLECPFLLNVCFSVLNLLSETGPIVNYEKSLVVFSQIMEVKQIQYKKSLDVIK